MSDAIEIVDDAAVEYDEQDSQPERAWNILGEDDIEIEEDDATPVEAPADDGPTLSELQARLDAMSTPPASDPALTATLDKLGDAIKTLNTGGATATQTAQAQETYADVMKKAKDGYFDAPVETVDKLIELKVREMVSPAFTQLAERVQKTEKSFTRGQAEADPTGKLVLDNYRDEVETIVAQGVLDYQGAVQQVAGKHMTELITMQVTAATEAAAAETPAPAANQNPATGTGRAPAAGRERIKLTRKLHVTLAAEAEQRGISTERYVKWVNENDPERLKGRK